MRFRYKHDVTEMEELPEAWVSYGKIRHSWGDYIVGSYFCIRFPWWVMIPLRWVRSEKLILHQLAFRMVHFIGEVETYKWIWIPVGWNDYNYHR